MLTEHCNYFFITLSFAVIYFQMASLCVLLSLNKNFKVYTIMAAKMPFDSVELQSKKRIIIETPLFRNLFNIDQHIKFYNND